MTFSQWLGDLVAEWYQQDNQRLGQLFVNRLHDSGRHALANSLCFDANDPFYTNEIHPDVLAYVERCWDSALAR